MTSQPVPNETIIVLPSNVINFSQAEKPEPTNQGQDSLKKHLHAEIKVIGTIQILCGMMVLSLGIILASASFSPNFTQVTSTLLNSAYPFIGPFFFMISGSLSIATEKRLTKLLVHSSLVGSILSALSALVGFIILSVKLATLNPASLQCELDKNNIPTRSYDSYYYHDSLYSTDCYTAKASLAGTLSLMLICTLLEFCLAVLTAVLRWKQAYSDFPGNAQCSLVLVEVLRECQQARFKALRWDKPTHLTLLTLLTASRTISLGRLFDPWLHHYWIFDCLVYKKMHQIFEHCDPPNDADLCPNCHFILTLWAYL
ncbi:membrane-spanning 4-domains subfamily A member 6A isoform X2 [Pongo abelii]|uniref:membrane-spanning 4-domains subfamily A member 6A isoform X2 n=1 Tax=Pongo abelii TaxID=9601 RepID=UPI0023E8E7B3|nr:membrane-spanning 4-domains subfamily A member 6A isoform X2 [Pongo abelii]XP_054380294.1 membrane-spanning 4-domains subfamily A member 6A isoform X2 [Pongo abelii]XP_054380295.1 membrane-spanning 4-domains subfamily A member 6A isoform X2 [Pongo abelii]